MTRSAKVSICRHAARALALIALCWLGFAARSSHPVAPPFDPDLREGRAIVLPGIHNTLFHLDGFVQMARLGLPNFEFDLRRWGTPFFGILNLRAQERNREFARRTAADIARWRAEHPDERLYLMGYSGGGGVAALVLEELPDGVLIDRVILIAPAISRGFDIRGHALDHVGEFVVNYASEKDMQVGPGTRYFGTIDRVYEYAAGYNGFNDPGSDQGSDQGAARGDARSDDQDDRLAHWQWVADDRAFGHRGNHVAYLGRRWQRQFLLPALDPALARSDLSRLWQARRAESD